MSLKTVVAGIIPVALLFASAHASSLTDRIATLVEQRVGVKPSSVRPAPVKGLYEVVVSRRIFYVDAKVDHLLSGRIFNIPTQTDLTAKRMEEISRIKWSDFPLQDAIKVVYGKGERQLVVFTDAKCSYCQVLERNLKQVGNVTVYNFVYPILNSKEMARGIVCADNPVKAWQTHMLTGDNPPPAPQKCDSSVLERNIALGQRLGFAATPTLVFTNGAVFSGALPTEQLEHGLKTLKQCHQATDLIRLFL